MTASQHVLLESPGFVRRVDELSSKSDLAWFLAMNTGLGFTLIAAYLFPQSPSGNFWAYAGLLIRASVYLWSGEALNGRGGNTLSALFKLGIVAGLFEILIDWGLIHWVTNGRLVYLTGNDVVLLGSPVWMPLAWACVTVELGYPAIRLFGLLKKSQPTLRAATISSLIIGLVAFVTVGFYEYFAYLAGWWKYEPANWMIGQFCAVYIPLGELFMFLTILPVAAKAISQDDRRMAASIAGGIQFAIAIGLGYLLAYLLLEAGRMP